ncbi:hypothetical protein OE88DRAFT_1649195 [Heliocybe sulcata]|uniref:DUF6532 domain-containing protein n=1 Tax=Heliocybe sulcata TaxID=5364 RepID=A0A5C3ML19_9AGAM|nr:hypothetical protein OE88DRAFT_1649195 [Heliocybe sulcata]
MTQGKERRKSRPYIYLRVTVMCVKESMPTLCLKDLMIINPSQVQAKDGRNDCCRGCKDSNEGNEGKDEDKKQNEYVVHEDSSAPTDDRPCHKHLNDDNDIHNVIEEAIGHSDASSFCIRDTPKYQEPVALEIMTWDSHVHGELKTKAQPFVETLYEFESSQWPAAIPQNHSCAEALLDDYNYLYWATPEYAEPKNAMWFNGPDDKGIRYKIECWIEEWQMGKKCSINFSAQGYKEWYEDSLDILTSRAKTVRSSSQLLRNLWLRMDDVEHWKGPMSMDTIAAAIQDYHAHGRLYDGSSEEEEEEEEDGMGDTVAR